MTHKPNDSKQEEPLYGMCKCGHHSDVHEPTKPYECFVKICKCMKFNPPIPAPPDNSDVELILDGLVDWIESGRTALGRPPSTISLLEAKAQINALIASAIQKNKDLRIQQNMSLCGCPMCTHHTDVYDRHVQQERSKRNG